MECITPGIQKNKVKKIFNINAPILPVVKMARGGSKKHKKYLMAIRIYQLIHRIIYRLDHKDKFLLLKLIAQV